MSGSVVSLSDAQGDILVISLNSSLFFNLIVGTYLTVYVGTIYSYVARKAPNRVFIPLLITAIFLLVVAQCVVQWWLVTWNFLWDNAVDSFISIFFPPQVPQVISIVTYALLVGASSTLIVFRAYSVVGIGYKRLRALVAFFYSSQNVSSVVTSGVATSNQQSQGPLANNLTAGMTFLGAATTALAGIIIACRVPFSINNRETIGFRKIFTYIMDVFIQSSFACPIMLLISAVSISLPSDNLPMNPPLFTLSCYSFYLAVIGMGMAPTLMVARMAFLPHPQQNQANQTDSNAPEENGQELPQPTSEENSRNDVEKAVRVRDI